MTGSARNRLRHPVTGTQCGGDAAIARIRVSFSRNDIAVDDVVSSEKIAARVRTENRARNINHGLARAHDAMLTK